MRVMVLVKATVDSEAGVMPSTERLEAMGRFNEELVNGLHESMDEVWKQARAFPSTNLTAAWTPNDLRGEPGLITEPSLPGTPLSRWPCSM